MNDFHINFEITHRSFFLKSFLQKRKKITMEC